MTAQSSHRFVTQEQIDQYQRDGILLIRNALTKDQIEAGRIAVEEAMAHPGPQAEQIGPTSSTTWTSRSDTFDGRSSSSSSSSNGDSSCSTCSPKPTRNIEWTMFQDQFSSQRCPKLLQWIGQDISPTVAALAGQLMQSSSATFFYDHIICKRPTTSSKVNQIPWHQDLPYWSVKGTFTSVWIPLDVMPSEAAVQWILGSHTWGIFRPQHFVDASPYDGTDDMEPMPDIDALFTSGQVQKTTFDVGIGDVLVFDARIIHGSPGNAPATTTATEPHLHRRIALRFGGDDAVYWTYPRETAIPTPDIPHGLFHGHRLCQSPIFPILWTASSSS